MEICFAHKYTCTTCWHRSPLLFVYAVHYLLMFTLYFEKLQTVESTSSLACATSVIERVHGKRGISSLKIQSSWEIDFIHIIKMDFHKGKQFSKIQKKFFWTFFLIIFFVNCFEDRRWKKNYKFSNEITIWKHKIFIRGTNHMVALASRYPIQQMNKFSTMLCRWFNSSFFALVQFYGWDLKERARSKRTQCLFAQNLLFVRKYVHLFDKKRL